MGKMNQRGFSMISLLIAVVIIMIVSAIMFKTLMPELGDKGVKHNSPKMQAVGLACTQSLQTIASYTNAYKEENDNQLPMSMALLASSSSVIDNEISNTQLWAETENNEDNPKFKSYHDEYFILEAYCNDGNFYTYDSRDGRITSEPFLPEEPPKK